MWSLFSCSSYTWSVATFDSTPILVLSIAGDALLLAIQITRVPASSEHSLRGDSRVVRPTSILVRKLSALKKQSYHLHCDHARQGLLLTVNANTTPLQSGCFGKSEDEWRSQEVNIPSIGKGRAALKQEWGLFLLAFGVVLVRYPELIFQQPRPLSAALTNRSRTMV